MELFLVPTPILSSRVSLKSSAPTIRSPPTTTVIKRQGASNTGWWVTGLVLVVAIIATAVVFASRGPAPDSAATAAAVAQGSAQTAAQDAQRAAALAQSNAPGLGPGDPGRRRGRRGVPCPGRDPPPRARWTIPLSSHRKPSRRARCRPPTIILRNKQGVGQRGLIGRFQLGDPRQDRF